MEYTQADYNLITAIIRIRVCNDRTHFFYKMIRRVQQQHGYRGKLKLTSVTFIHSSGSDDEKT